MKRLTCGLCCVALGTVFSLTALGQPGGGGGGFGGGGGGGGFGGGGGGFGGGGGGGQEQAAPQGQPLAPVSETLPGRWDIEFRAQYFSADPTATGRILEVRADLYISGDLVEGRIDESNMRGIFRCTFDGNDRCQNGMMRFDGEQQDWQDFGFEVDDNRERATGWAEWVNVDTGEIMRFELRMRKR